MRVGLTVWDSRISPVADAAAEVLVVRRDDGEWVSEDRVRLPNAGHGRAAAAISALDLDVLVCGAVSRRYAAMLEQAGVRVLAWVAGEWRDVLEALSDGELTSDRFIMAGCGRRRRGGGAVRGRHRGGGRCG